MHHHSLMAISRPISAMDLLKTAKLAIFIFLIIILPSTGAINCPSNCHCLQDAQHRSKLKVECRWTNILQSFEHFDHDQTKSLTIRCSGGDQQQLSAFRPNHFSEFDNLWHLHIDGCATHSIPRGTFAGLGSLRTLRLENLGVPNQSLDLSPDALTGLVRLEKLVITNSHIAKIPHRTFCQLVNLHQLDLSSNWLNRVQLGFGEDGCVPQLLVMLDMSKNRVNRLQVADLAPLGSLHVLSLAGNQLTTIDEAAFTQAVHIQTLDLKENALVDVPELPKKLLRLDMSNNQLQILPKSVAGQRYLIALNVSGNKLDSNSPFPINGGRLETLDLSRNAFNVVPSELLQNATSLVELSLDSNQISGIEDGAFTRHPSLIRLSLANNIIVKLSAEAFDGLENVTTLLLSGNAISDIDNEAFANLQQLMDMDLSGNVLLEVPYALRRLYRLTTLDLSENKIDKSYKFLFNKLPFLQTLKMSGNQIAKVDSYVFSDMPRLAVLDLGNNNIENVTNDAFDKCPRLSTINLGGNFIDRLSTAFGSLRELRSLNLTANLLTGVDFQLLPESLVTLSASSNRISALVNGAVDRGNLRKLDLSENYLTLIAPQSLPNTIEAANFSRNTIEQIKVNALAAKKQLKWIDLSGNKLADLEEDAIRVQEGVVAPKIYLADNTFICSCKLDWIRKPRQINPAAEIEDLDRLTCRHVIHDNIEQLGTMDRTKLLCRYQALCSNECPCCRFGACDCKSVCPPGCECFHDQSQSINIVRCSRLNDADFSPKSIPMYASHVHLDRVHLPVIKSHDFLGRDRLQQLFVNHSEVQTIQPLAFNGLPALELLDLSGNQLVQVTGAELHDTPKIRHLFLNNNAIGYIGMDLAAKLPGLQTLTLANNQLPDLPGVVSALAPKSLYSLTVGHNPFRCDCDRRFYVQQWLAIGKNRQKVFDLDNVYCVENATAAYKNNDTTVLSAFPPNVGTDIFQIPYLDFETRVNETFCQPTASSIEGPIEIDEDTMGEKGLFVLALIAAVFIIVLLIILGLVMLKKAQAAMDHKRYKAPPSLNSSSVGTASTPIPLITYDAFVSYSKEDDYQVQEKLCRPLEEQDYCLCLLHRDISSPCSPGMHAVQDELITRMDRSQCLILVLTANFLKTEWQTVQVRIAHQVFAKKKNKKLIVVLSDEVKSSLNSLDQEMGRIVRQSPCLDWSGPRFWAELTKSMPQRVMDDSNTGSSTHYSDLYGTIVPSHIV